MWTDDLPGLDDDLRQGDLLDLQYMPLRGSWTLDANGLASDVKIGRALVLDRCCTVEQKHTVLLAVVGRVGISTDPDHRFTRALRGTSAESGRPYAFYEHLLEDHPEALPGGGDRKAWVAKLVDRVSLASNSSDGFVELRKRRVARMTIPARAQLRTKLVAHFGRPENDDAAWLAENGYNVFGIAET